MKLNLCDQQYLDAEGLLYLFGKLKQLILQSSLTLEEIERIYGIKAGPTISRPKTDLKIGLIYFDTDLNKPIWWDGILWIDANGDNADILHRGNSESLPKANEVSVGFSYYNVEDKTLYASNGEYWEVINCCGSPETIIWAYVEHDSESYESYDYLGWSSLQDNSYFEIEDLNDWSNI